MVTSLHHLGRHLQLLALVHASRGVLQGPPKSGRHIYFQGARAMYMRSITFGLVKAQRIAPRCLGLVHRHVGLFQQLIHIGQQAVVQTYPNTG